MERLPLRQTIPAVCNFFKAKMKYYPLFLNVANKTCCIVGGGSVAERKARSLLAAGADVHVISPALCAGLAARAHKKKITHHRCAFTPRLLRDAFLVIAATNDRAVNQAVSRVCRKQNILVNVVDVPEESNFIVPACARRNGVVIAISTSGKAPCLAKKIRRDLEKEFLPRYGRLLSHLEQLRAELKERCPGAAARRKILNRLVGSAKLWRKPCKTARLSRTRIRKLLS